MSGTSGIDIDYSKTSWIKELNKPKLIAILTQLGLKFDEAANIDVLRKILRCQIRKVNEEKESKQVDKTEPQGSVQEDNKETIQFHTMAETNSNISRLEFHLGKDDWEMYTERLELYFVANDVRAEKQAAVLLTKISPNTYKLVRDLCAPEKPSTKTFEELVKLINNHLNPKPSETMERCTFYQARQSQTESVSEFAARLKSLSINCNFGDAKIALCDQLVCGVKDHTTKTLLFREDKLTYDSAYKLATALETAEKYASSTDQAAGEPSKTIVNKISSAPKPEYKRQLHTRGRGADRGRRGGNQRYLNRAPMNRGNRSTSENASANTRRSSACFRCGRNNHWARDCYHRFSTCNSCKRKGHLETVCTAQKAVQHLEQESEDQQGDKNDFFMMDDGRERKSSRITSSNANCSSDNITAEPMYLDVLISNRILKMEMDTGSYATIISKRDEDRYFPNCEVKLISSPLNAYGKVPLEHVGTLDNLQVKIGNEKASLGMRVMKGDGPMLIGRQWLKVFGLWPLKLNKRADMCNKIYGVNETMGFPTKFPKLFGKGPGLYNKGMLKLTLKENTQPVALKARHLPFALASKVENEIDRLVTLGHLEKVDVSEWATPIVPVIKTDGTVRICGNFKLTLNPNLVKDRHPIPLIDEIFLALRSGKTFSQIDLQHAYMQIPVEESSRDYLTIITHKGLYRYTKMPEGIASGPGDFQRKIEQCLAGIDGVIPYIDNIFCTGKDDKEHLEALNAVFKRLEDYGFKVNISKCDFFKEKLDILGFVIDQNGLHKSKTKVKAMIEAPTPVNKKQLDSFLGLITYYARFLPQRAEKLKCLYECTKADNFNWTEQCDKAFEWVKGELVSPRVLAHYHPNTDLILSCDASTYGLGAILSHKYKDGTERPIAFASKIIPEKEASRAIIDKEASAIVFGFKKFYNYVFGKEITLRTDHKPLVFIFGPKQEIPLTIASRLQRWAYFLSRFNYNIEYIKSQQNGNCDALSRLPINDATPVFDDELSSINYISESLQTLSAVEIAKETKKDKVLNKIVRYVNGTWPSVSELSEREQKYYAKRDELYVEKECLLWGYRIIAPESMKNSVLSELHASHFGVVKMKMLARSHVWWPNIDNDIQNVSAACRVCVQERKKPPSVPLTPWPYPDNCWSRIHIDFLGPFHGHMFMIIVDAYSKWPEVIDMNKSTTVPRVLEEVKKVLSRFGLPRHVVTDNGTQFTSKEFQEFCKINGIRQSFTAPHHPATNGAAENFVGTFKDKVDKIVQTGKPLDYAVNLFLFDYRSIEHCTTGRSPSFMMYKREIKTRFDLLRPSVLDSVEKQQSAQIAGRKSSRIVEFQIGDTVMVEDFSVRSKARVPGTITKKLSPVTFLVETAPNKTWKRHVDQIIRYTPEIDDINKSVPKVTTNKSDIVLRRSNRLKN
nr:uncharacterized protein K02A2.6-like [Neodiprion pinetum]